MLDENVSPAANQPDSRAVGQPLVFLVSCPHKQPPAGKLPLWTEIGETEEAAGLGIAGNCVHLQRPTENQATFLVHNRSVKANTL
eukprot:1138531-Pelagomonas_calceolata.AAC.15